MPFQQEFTALGNGLARSLSVVVRTSADESSMAPLMRSAVAGVDTSSRSAPFGRWTI